MAVVYKSDLVNVNNYVNSILNNENSDTQKIIDAINDFINTSSDTLKGSAWDKERERMSSFVTALEKRKKISSSLLNSVLSADRVMLDYLASYPKINIDGVKLDFNMIDTALLDQLQTQLLNAKNSYNNILNQSPDKTHELAQQKLNIEACETMIKYIEELPGKDALAYSKYNEVVSELSAFNSSINDIGNL